MKKTTPLDLSGKHAIVTGGGRGIGAAIVSALAQAGANITLMGRNKSTIEQHAKTLNLVEKQQVFCQSVDVTDPKSIEQAFRISQGKLGAADIFLQARSKTVERINCPKFDRGLFMQSSSG
jgi:NAD(P)-dependent dehydrogenase (short-subunit alcohol dehydrogenase family)